MEAERKDALQVCIFHQITGVACPSCGTTRSILYLLRGDIITSISINPFGLVVFSGMLILPVLMVYDLLTKNLYLVKLYVQSEDFFRKPKVAIPFVIVVLLNWFWNIYKDL